ncbi:regulatory protein RecX [Philodulcilactobacillus myokoensis]|uniref:Regulatory protein RecX n=1 Tax=Philodulcilactobacillus myokoensis TaxID=2929573 RepID=A0A9W6B1C6_9LACO|nr:RecX family transcriptional regulator [Philodulcilactobacillus myokoensis]GLB47052.1 regulatory protein RecX [Philodulcilactobacillus myokoensis]
MANKITKIKAQKRKGRYNVYINQHYAFPISESVMIKYRVFKGMEVDEKLKQKLEHADNISKLYNRAIDYLANQLRTENEIRVKLKSITDDPDAIEMVVQHLKNEKLVDDRNYANSYVRTKMRINAFGPNKIIEQLKLKHIDENLIDEAIDNNYEHHQLIDNGVYQAERIFKKHQHDAFRKRIQKTKIGMVRKGFSYPQIDEIMTQIEFQPDDDHQRQLLNQKGQQIWHQNRGYDLSKRILKTKQKLYRRGFLMDDINSWIDRIVQN